MEDDVSKKLLQLLGKSKEPLETAEIVSQMPSVSREKVMRRLRDLRGDGKIKGKQVGAGPKGAWIWWK